MAPTSMPTPSSTTTTARRTLPKELRDAYNYYFGAVFGGWAENSNLTSVTKVDDSTVTFTLKTPQSNFLIAQAPLPQFGIQSPTALKAGDADNPDPTKSKYAQGQGTGMVGTGPFKFKEWVPNDHVTIAKNPNYWNKDGVAHLDEVIFKPFADQSAELNALQSDGGIDVAQTILPNRRRRPQGRPDLQVIDRGESCNYGGLQMNQTHKPFDNLHIRTAIAYAVNKQSYIDAFYAGLAEPADNWMPPATQFYKTLNLPTYESQKAKDEIAASGLSGGPARPRLLLPVGRRPPVHAGPEGPGQGDRDATSRRSASRSRSTPRGGGPATWPTRPSGSSRCGSSAGPATGRVPTTSSTRRSSTSTATSRTRSSPTVRRS